MKKTFKQMMHMALALLLALALTAPALATETETAELPAPTENVEETAAPAETEAPAATEAPAETEAPAATEAPAETEAPAATEIPAVSEEELPANARLMAVIEDALNAERSVSIYAAYDGDYLSFGDRVTLIAVLHGYENVTYEIQWQSSANDAAWDTIPGAKGASYAFEISEENYRLFWRASVTVTGVIVADELAAAAE